MNKVKLRRGQKYGKERREVKEGKEREEIITKLVKMIITKQALSLGHESWFHDVPNSRIPFHPIL